MANTVIQLKYSNVTGTPPSLNVAEPAYSNVSNKLWIDDGTAVVAIGGKHFTDIIDAATSANTANTIVLRDNDKNFSANIITANLNGKLVNARNIALGGDANGTVSFDASQDVTITVDLTASGVTAGHYGSTTKIPTFQVDTDGRLIAASNVNVATTLSFSGDSGSGTLDLLNDGLKIQGDDGITSVAVDANNTVVIHVDNTVVKTDRSSQTINGDIAITGNLIVSGNTITQDVENIRTEDSLIKLAANNASDALDIGFYGQYENGGTKYAGLVRDASDGVFKLFVGETTDPTDNVLSYGVETIATLHTNLTGNTISVVDGAFSNGVSILGDLSVGGNTNIGSISFGALGDISATSLTLIDALTVPNGGTGNTSFTTNHVVIGNGTGALTTVGSATEGHILTINSSGAPTFQHLQGGTF
jgi:hypothetical protein